MSNNGNSNPFDISPEAADRLNQGMNLGGGIELPFSAPVFWWLNGTAQSRPFAQTTPALYYGGWACNAEDIEAVLDDRGSLPGGLVETEIFTREGKNIPTYTSRALIIAPIGFRSCWTVGARGAQTRSIQYVPGSRQHIQVLGLFGMRMPDGTYKSWGPITLSAKGYQAQYLQSALKDWKKALEKPRREHAPKVPAWAFWCALGTFGANPETSMVGKTGAQSPVTPINLFVPKDITLDTMRKIYVGRAGVDEMADLQEEADEWLNAWKNQTPAAAAASADDYPLEPVEPGEEEIPF